MSEADKIAAWLGFAGFLLALASLTWQCVSFLLQRRERVSAELWFVKEIDGSSPGIVLRVWNSGRIPVYIQKAEVCFGDRRKGVGKKQTAIGFSPMPTGTSRRHGMLPLTDGVRAQVAASGRQPLSVGEEKRFRLLAQVVPPALLQQVCALPESEVWVSVYSPEGAILRLKGSTVLPVLSVLRHSQQTEGQRGSSEPGSGSEEE